MEDDFDISTDNVEFFSQPYLFEPKQTKPECAHTRHTPDACAHSDHLDMVVYKR